MFVAVIFGKGSALLWGYMAAVIHECAHLAVCIYLGIKPEQITLGLCGMNLRIKGVSGIKEHMMILAAGPAASFFVFGALFLLRRLQVVNVPVFEFANLCICIANLIPAMPLDGGSMLRCALVSAMGVINGAKLMRKITMALCVLTGGICIFIQSAGYVNVFLIVFEIFLISSLRNEQKAELFEKKMVLSGQMSHAGKLKYFALNSECELLEAAAKISPSYFMIAAVFECGRYIGEVNQRQICDAIKKYGASCGVGTYLKNNFEVLKNQ